MFHIDYICEGVYDLWWQDGEEDYGWEYVGTYDSYEIAQEEADAFNFFCNNLTKDYNL